MSTPIQKIDSIGPAQENSESQPDKSQAQLDYDEGRGYVERGEAALAAVALHNALLGFEEENNKEGIAKASNQIGHACLLREEFDKADDSRWFHRPRENRRSGPRRRKN